MLSGLLQLLAWLGSPTAIIGSIGTPEILIILVIALVVLGPGKLPEVAKKIGKGLRELRRATDDLRSGFYEDVREVRTTLRDAEAMALASEHDRRPPETAKDAPADDGAPPADDGGTILPDGAAAAPDASPADAKPAVPGTAPAASVSTPRPRIRPAENAVPVEQTSSRPRPWATVAAAPGAATAAGADSTPVPPPTRPAAVATPSADPTTSDGAQEADDEDGDGSERG